MSVGSRSCGLVCRLPASPSNLRLLEGLAACGLSAQALHPAAVTRGHGPLLCRLPSGTPAAWLAPLLLAEHAGQVFLNRPSVLGLAHDKPAALARLSSAGLPVPPTLCVVRDGPCTLDALPGERFVVKPASGASGHGVTVGLGRADAAACARAFADASGPALVQPVLGDGVDRRLFMAGDRLVAAMERRPAPRDGRGNLAYGARSVSLLPSSDELHLARAACQTLALDVAAVDLLVHEGRALVLEVNTAPGLIGLERATGVDVAGAVAALLSQRVEV